MNSWKIILATVVIFAAGVFTGGLLVNVIKETPRSREPRTHAEAKMPEPPMAARLNKEFLKQLDEKLELTPDQHEKIQKIVAEGQERNHALWTNVAPKMREVMQDVNRQIRQQLSPKQQKDFEELVKQFHPPHRPAGTNAAATRLSRTNAVSPAAKTNAP